MERFQKGEPDGLLDCASRLHKLRRPTQQVTLELIVQLRRQRIAGQQIARHIGVSPRTVSRVLRRAGISHLPDLDPAPRVRRQQRAHPGELFHLDIKTLGRVERAGHRVTGYRRDGMNAAAPGSAG